MYLNLTSMSDYHYDSIKVELGTYFNSIDGLGFQLFNLLPLQICKLSNHKFHSVIIKLSKLHSFYDISEYVNFESKHYFVNATLGT